MTIKRWAGLVGSIIVIVIIIVGVWKQLPLPPKPAVAILVIDTFGRLPNAKNVTPTVMATPNKEKTGENCLAVPEGQTHSSTQPIWATPGVEPHGELVYKEVAYQIEKYQIQNGIASTNNPVPTLDPANIFSEQWAREIEQFDTNMGTIYLVKIDTDGFTTGVISERIRQAVSSTEQNLHVHKIVLNMSFAIVPCDLKLASDDLQKFKKSYLTDLASEDEYKDLEKMLEDGFLSDDERSELISTYPAFGPALLKWSYTGPGSTSWLGSLINDPLYLLLNGIKAYGIDSATPPPGVISLPGDIISVAASGNFGGDFPEPLAPARWPNVVSVSADPIPASDFIASPGEVKMDGELSAPHTPLPGGTPDPLGTSFSAPKLSFFEALYLLEGGSISCSGADKVTAMPPLGYADSTTTTPSPWRNLDVAKAAQEFCETPVAFPTP